MPAPRTPRRGSLDRTWDKFGEPETMQLTTVPVAGADPRLSKRSAVVKNALRHRANSCGSVPAGQAAPGANWSLGRQQTMYVAERLLAGCSLEALVAVFPNFCASYASEVEGGSGGDTGSQSEYRYPALPGLPRRPKTGGGGAPSASVENRLRSAAQSRGGQRATAGGSPPKGPPQPTEQRQPQRHRTSSAVAAAAGGSEAATAATRVASGSSAVPLQSIVGGEEPSDAENARQSTPQGLRAAIQSGHCTLECDMSEAVKSDFAPAALLRKYHRDKGLHYGQIKLALSRNQILEGAAIRDPGGEELRAQALDKGHSLRLNGLRGSMPNISLASDAVSSLPLSIPSVKNQLKGPLLVSGILNPGDEATGSAAGAGKGRGAAKGASLEEPRQPPVPAPSAAQGVAQDSVNWQQVLGPQRIPTVTKPPTISSHASAGAGGPSATSISLPQRRYQTKLVGGPPSGGGGFAGPGKTSRRPDSSCRQEGEPRYADPFAGAPTSVQARLAELAVLEAETVRWERAGGKMKKKVRERED